MNLYLVRHGETDWNNEGRAQGRANIALNDQGIAQSVALGAHFAPQTVAAVYSSSADRATQTAQHIADPHGLSVRGKDELLELDFGGLDGAPLREMRSRFPAFFEHWTRDPATARFPDGGETLEILQARTWAMIEEIAGAHEIGETVVVVSHAFAIYSIMCRALGMPLSNYGRLRISPGTISMLAARAGNVLGQPGPTQWSLSSLNYAPTVSTQPA